MCLERWRRGPRSASDLCQLANGDARPIAILRAPSTRHGPLCAHLRWKAPLCSSRFNCDAGVRVAVSRFTQTKRTAVVYYLTSRDRCPPIACLALPLSAACPESRQVSLGAACITLIGVRRWATQRGAGISEEGTAAEGMSRRCTDGESARSINMTRGREECASAPRRFEPSRPGLLSSCPAASAVLSAAIGRQAACLRTRSLSMSAGAEVGPVLGAGAATAR